MIYYRLYQPSKTAMQSGKAKTKSWVLESYDPEARFSDPIMEWPGTTDTQDSTKLFFDTLDEAMAYAESQGITPTIIQTAEKKSKPKSYADNFTKGLRV